jgi:predicted RNA binding protein YcfA (HicA-like mRNA interferase family)
MPKFPIISSKQIIKALQSKGFIYAPKRGKGSHVALMKRDSEKTRLVIIPDRKAIPRGTLRAILDQAGLTKEEFLSILNIK